MTATFRTILLATAALSAALLAGCQNPSADPAPEASPAAEEPPVISVPAAEPSETPVASIIRPEVVADAAEEAPSEAVKLTVPFPKGAALTPAAEQQLAGLLNEPALGEGWAVVVRGHSDSDGTDSANLATSRRRAQAVADWLAEHGVAAGRIRVIALGEQNPAAPNARPDGTPNEDGRARNRRVEITVAPPEGARPPEPEEEPRGPTIVDRKPRD